MTKKPASHQSASSPLKKLLLKTGLLGAFIGVFITIEFLIIRFNGSAVPVPVIPRAMTVLGHGKTLTYAVLGDSTTVAQGALYGEGYAYMSAKHLARHYSVHFINAGVSGAKAADVASLQVAQVVRYAPDVALLAVGANDVTGLTRISSVEHSLQQAIDALRAANPAVKIIVTGAPDMGSVPRLPWPVRQLVGLRTHAVNHMVERLVASNNLVFARIAEKTGPAFAADAGLFAADKFHPNAHGYALWTPVINEALDTAIH
jgi:lysophospholipase L1-like esterase